MDLEHLTKHQIVLLTLLVSFVTSIATGIVTVSLVNQAPPEVTRTINQIVEHTVEKVVPATQGASVAASTVTEHTVVVKDDDLAAQSIAKMQKALVRIVVKGGDLLVSRGVIVSGNGVALVDRDALMATGVRQFEAILADGKRYPAALRQAPSNQSLGVVDIAVGTSTGFAAATLTDISKVQLGQSVIRIGGTGSDSVGTGVVASLADPHPGLIEASVSSATPGSVLMTLFGEIIGIDTGSSRTEGSTFYSVPSAALFAPPSAS
ncbi:MAG TPA: hypothetical protein VGP13_00925 [Candidatus Paceibacterota bacterium]|jgi:hypothetical protein|nr:hypothetical protein [Candidatus Paceibacterota bacterium]